MGHILGYTLVFLVGWIVMPQPAWADKARQWCYTKLRAFGEWVRAKVKSGSSPS